MKKRAIACGLLVGVVILSLLWIFREPPYRLRLLEQKMDKGRRITVFRLDARTRHRINLGEVKIYRLGDAGNFLDEQTTPEWLRDDPRGIYFRDHTEFAMMAPTNCNQ